MPKIKYRASRDIPTAIRELKSFSPSEIRLWVLKNFNKSITPEAISNWVRRHPDEIDELRDELINQQVSQEEITESVYKVGTFELFPSVRKWYLALQRRDVQNASGQVSTLKRVCLGIKPNINPRTQQKYRKGEKERDGTNGIDLKDHGWVMVHPERLDVESFNRWEDLMREHYPQVDTSGERMAVRGFLSANGVQVGSQISGQKSKSAGKYSRLFCARPILQQIFDDLRRSDFESYVIDRFMFLTGTRINATLNARLENLRELDGVYDLRIYDKGRRSKNAEGKPWDKYISPELLEDIKALTGYPEKKTGKIFQKTKEEMAETNRRLLEEYYPELWEAYPNYANVNHFWRHMFAQHMLRKTGWNYGIVASLGGWDVKSLEESYGKPPAHVVKQWGQELMSDL